MPPLPENYFGSQIDEVSSTRDSIIENESKINKYKISAKEQLATVDRLSNPKWKL